MLTDDLIRKLSSLAQLDRDATSVYDEAIKHAMDDDVQARFKQFRAEHENHVSKISAAMERLGGPALDLKVDALGHLADWVTAFRSMGGQQGALHAMRTAEKYHNSRYGEAAGWEVEDPELLSMLEGFYAEERHHLEFVEAKLGAHAAASRQA
jgi:rubrerythrin